MRSLDRQGSKMGQQWSLLMRMIGKSFEQLAVAVVVGDVKFRDRGCEAENRKNLAKVDEMALGARDRQVLQVVDTRKETRVKAGRMIPAEFQLLEIGEAVALEAER